MSSESIPSKPFNFFDVPEISSLTAQFQYNFWTVNEVADESGDDAVNGNLGRRFRKKGTADMGNLNARVPRYIKLDFQVRDSKKSMLATRNSSVGGRQITNKDIQRLLASGKIFSETQACGKEHDSYLFSNSNIATSLELAMFDYFPGYVVFWEAGHSISIGWRVMQ